MVDFSLVIYGITGGIKAIGAMVDLYEKIRRDFGPNQRLTEEQAAQIKAVGSKVEGTLTISEAQKRTISSLSTNPLFEKIVERIKEGVNADLGKISDYMRPDRFPDELSRDRAITTIKRDICWQIKQLKELGDLEEAYKDVTVTFKCQDAFGL